SLNGDFSAIYRDLPEFARRIQVAVLDLKTTSELDAVGRAGLNAGRSETYRIAYLVSRVDLRTHAENANGTDKRGGAAGRNSGHPDRQRRRDAVEGSAVGDPARRAARSSRPDRHQERLRSRPMRRLHGAGRRPADQLLPDARRDEG